MGQLIRDVGEGWHVITSKTVVRSGWIAAAQLEIDGPGVQASYMISSNVADATSVGLPSPFSPTSA
jgi:hypothetical protein